MSITVTNVYEIPYQHWVFVPEKHMGEKNISEYYGPRRNNETLLKKTTAVKNTYEDKERNMTYVAGPPRQDVEQSTGKKFQPVTVKENDKPGQKINNESVEIYRPQVKPTDESGKKPAPAKVVNLKDRNPMEKKTEPKEEPKDIKNVKKDEVPETKKDNLPKDSPPEVKKVPEKNKVEPKQEKILPRKEQKQVTPPQEKPKQEPPQVKPPKKEPMQNPAPERKPTFNPSPPKQPMMAPRNPGGMKKGNPH
jgi:hypothetical protein